MNLTRTGSATVISMAAILVTITPQAGWAAWGGTEDGNAHPMVGAMYADFTNDGIIQWFELICSGAYAGPSRDEHYDVFLTAGHCVGPVVVFNGITEFWVSFDPDPLGSGGIPTGLIPADAFDWDPRFGHDLGNLYDSAVLLLPAGSVHATHPGLAAVQLPPAGFLDEWKAAGDLKHALIELVGYGVVPTWQQPGGTSFAFDGVRRTSLSQVKGLTLAWLKFNQNVNATGLGGLCFGDSGSPQFIPGTLMIVSTTSGGNGNCNSENYNYRLDTQGAREFLGLHLNLP